MDERTAPTSDPNPRPGEAGGQPGDAGLHELAIALLAPRYSDMPEGDAPRLLPGQLPPSVTGAFPLPPGSRVVGSLTATQPTIVLDTDQSAEDVVDFYRQRLTADGWSTQEDMQPRQGGFLHSSMFNRRFGTFYRGEDGPSLSLMTFAAPSGHTLVHLTLNPEGARELYGGGGPRRQRMRHDIWSILPPIAPPPRGQQWQEGGSGGGDRVISSARVESDLDLPAIVAHYNTQLERGGWQRQDSGENAPVAWSTWTFADEDKDPWRAFFILLQRPDMPGRYWAQVIAEWAGERPRSGGTGWVSGARIGWQSHSPMLRRP